MASLITIERSVQRIGAFISRRVFSDERLQTPWGERAYLLLYGAFKRIFEHAELRSMSRFAAPGSTVVDIGANVGFMTQHFSDWVGERGTVLAIEPDPVMVGLLMNQLARGGRRRANVQVLPIAIGGRSGRTMLYRNLANRADNRMGADDEQVPPSARREVEVTIRTLPDVLAEQRELPNVSLIKVDTQGHEVDVIKGMRAWLRSCSKPPVLAVECWPYGLRVAGTSIDTLFATLNDAGYRVPSAVVSQFPPDAGPDVYDSVLFFPDAATANETENANAKAALAKEPS